MPPTYKSPPAIVDKDNVVPIVTDPATSSLAFVLLIDNVPVAATLPPTVTTAFIAPVVKVAPVLIVRVPAIALAVPASAFSSVNVALLLTKTLFG